MVRVASAARLAFGANCITCPTPGHDNGGGNDNGDGDGESKDDDTHAGHDDGEENLQNGINISHKAFLD